MISVIKDRYNMPQATKNFILQMCWAQHDGQWFLKAMKRYGVKEGNSLNQEVISSMGKIEARHILNTLGIKKGRSCDLPYSYSHLGENNMKVIFAIIHAFAF